MKVADTIERYLEWNAMFGFDLWGEFGEDNEIHHDDPRLAELLEHGRVVSLVDYGCDCEDIGLQEAEHIKHEDDMDWVMRGWAMVDVVRRVVLPLGWREPEFEKWEVPA